MEDVHGAGRSRFHLMKKPRSIHDYKEWFQVLDGTERSQAAIMKLEPGKASGDEAEAHEGSDQILLVTEGEVEGEIEGDTFLVRAGEFILIPAGTKHRFVNRGDVPALTFNVYAPPVYPDE